MEKNRTFDEFVEIIAKLRSEDGCPWDREQTLNTLKPCVMEEAAEVCAAIRIYDTSGNYENLREELGDLLLQVVMQSQIAKEAELFTVEEVIDEIAEKMIRRHPHVFGEVRADDSAEVLKNWEEIKRVEKTNKTWIETPLTEIPRELPALTRATKVLKKIDKIYEEQKTAKESVSNLKEQISKLEENMESQEESEAILGTMLLEISNVAREKKIQSEQLLTEEIEKQIDKYEKNAVKNA